ncbi:hypothetical protein BDM02DRAFT_3182878 [Thelephora ganbajun]|uniref:Uncharacterized protein n=1 Tax=Thelephora ganbajun TaxID=370292 RepID=A0ACB6ZVL3_THEGA|nr:hypothetical protein BDM02DRAFT_3182878 [Thelephora ganbajun]
MKGARKGEKSETESPPLQVDPKCFQDALRAFFQPIKTDDPRLDFYTMYNREATGYDTDYVKKYDDDLNTTLIFAGLFSAVSSAFVIGVQPKLEPDPNEQSVALLRVILLTLNRSAILGETPVVPPVWKHPPSKIVTVTCLMYASLLMSLLAAFVAMLGKQWLNRYMRNSGGFISKIVSQYATYPSGRLAILLMLMIDRCGDRQRKFDGLKKWRLDFFIESLPVMLQIALLLACGLCRYMAAINPFVAGVLIAFTVLGVLFYVGIVTAGTSSHDCPFQAPGSSALRSLWTKIRPHLVTAVLLTITPLRNLGGIVQYRIFCIMVCLPCVNIRHHFRGLSEKIQLGILHVGLRLPQTVLNIHRRLRHSPLPTVQENSRSAPSQIDVPWLTPKDLATILTTSTNDARCVSWILRNITDPEVLDAAIRLAGTIRWFEDGIDVEPPYELIVSTFHACFGSNKEVYPGSRDRAYYSGRAILWIHTLAKYHDHDLGQLLAVSTTTSVDLRFYNLFDVWPRATPPHLQWISNVLLHLSWINRATLDSWTISTFINNAGKYTVPLDALLNRLLAWCTFLGSTVEEEVLKVQDKFDRLEQSLHQLSKAIVSAINATHPQRLLIQAILRDLTKLENLPRCITEMAYEWCSATRENHSSFEGWESVLLLSLEVGFRHLNLQRGWIDAKLIHTEHHQELVDVVFESKDSEEIADLLHAWTARGWHNQPARTLLDACVGHLVGLHHMVPFSPRLRRLVIRFIELIGYEGFEEVGAERFIGLLNHLHIGIEDMDHGDKWLQILFDTIRSPEGTRCLPIQSWELLVELVLFLQWIDAEHSPQVTASLLEAQEWDKLECWMGVVWMVWPPGTDEMTGDFEHAMMTLFRQRPSAVEKHTRWMEQWSEGEGVPESFQQTCERSHEIVQVDVLSSPLPDERAEESLRSPPPPSLLSRGNTFWESLPYHAF